MHKSSKSVGVSFSDRESSALFILIRKIFPYQIFNLKLAVSYQLPANSNLTINVLDINGRLVDTLYTGYQTAGNFALNWDASAQPSGIYFIHAIVDNGSAVERFVEKCLLMK